QYAGAPPASQALPHTTVPPAASKRATISLASRDLPMPGSPLNNNDVARPAQTDATTSSTTASSWSRPNSFPTARDYQCADSAGQGIPAVTHVANFATKS